MGKLLNKYKELPPIMKGTIFFMLITFLNKGFAVISTPIFTRLMTKADYGTYALYNSWYNIFSVLCTFNISVGIFNSIVVKEPEKISRISSCVIGFEILITTVMGGLYFLVCLFTDGLLGIANEMGFLIFIENLFNIPILIWVAIQKFNNNYIKGFVVMISEMVIKTALCILLVVFWDEKVYARILGTVFTYVGFGIVLFVIIIKDGKAIFDKEIWKILLVVGGPLVFHYLAQNILAQSDQIMIKYFWGEEETANYSLAHSLAWLLGIFNIAINATFIPWMYKKIKRKDYSKISDVCICCLVVLGGFILIISLLAPEVLLVYGGEEYVSGKILVPILCCAVMFMFVYKLFTEIELYYQKTNITMIATIIASVVNIALNFVLIPKYKAFGASIATFISYIIVCAIHFFAAKRIMRKNGEKLSSVYNTKILLGLTLVLACLIMLVQLLFDFLWIRIIISVVVLVVTIVIVFRIFKSLGLLKSKKVGL